METVTLFVGLLVVGAPGGSTPGGLKVKQNQAFQRFWGTEFVWKFSELPTKGTVPKERQPYSGYIYPDRRGGTADVLKKYDRAFHGYSSPATAYERRDTSYKEPGEGLFGALFPRTPNWYGHCNGWTAAAIRHAEPKRNVRRGGVVFTPTDIKALLAEIYMYNDVEHLVGLDYRMEPGVFHAIIANWIGRGLHSLGMEVDPTKEKWNYPAVSFSSSAAKRKYNRVEVRTNVAYIKDTWEEYTESPKNWTYKEFHYMLNLSQDGEIIGGYFFKDSALIDMLWIPLRPKLSGQRGNEAGNPYVNVDKVLAIWRESVPADVRKKSLTIDPSPQDRVIEVSDVASLVPQGYRTTFRVTTPTESQTTRQLTSAAENQTTRELPIPVEKLDASSSDDKEDSQEEPREDLKTEEEVANTIERETADETAETVSEQTPEVRPQDPPSEQPPVVGLDELRGQVRACLAGYYQDRCDIRRHSPRAVMANALAYGVDAKVYRDDESVNAIGWLCWNGHCNGQRLFHAADGKLVANSDAGRFLAVLALSKVKSGYRIKVDDHAFTIKDLIEHEKLTCRSGADLTDKLIGLAHYLDSDASWENNNGENWSIPTLLRAELSRPVAGAADRGIHWLLAFSVAAHNRKKEGKPLDGQWRRADTYVKAYQEYAFKLQKPDGSLDTKWLSPHGSSADSMVLSGKILEWLVFSLPEDQLSQPRVLKAMDHLARQLQDYRGNDWESNVTAHALHALAAYDERVFSATPGDRSYLENGEYEMARRPRAP